MSIPAWHPYGERFRVPDPAQGTFGPHPSLGGLAEEPPSCSVIAPFSWSDLDPSPEDDSPLGSWPDDPARQLEFAVDSVEETRLPAARVSLSEIDVPFGSLVSFMVRLILAGLVALLFVASALASLVALLALVARSLAGR